MAMFVLISAKKCRNYKLALNLVRILVDSLSISRNLLANCFAFKLKQQAVTVKAELSSQYI